MKSASETLHSVLVKYANKYFTIYLKSLFEMGEQWLLKQRISKLLPPKLNISSHIWSESNLVIFEIP